MDRVTYGAVRPVSCGLGVGRIADSVAVPSQKSYTTTAPNGKTVSVTESQEEPADGVTAHLTHTTK